jgi:CHAD domain-containing protein
MGFELSAADPTVEAAVRRIATERIDAAVAAIARGDDEGVHDARKRLKELRALVRLVAPGLRRARREERAFRDAGRALSGPRDAAATAAVFERLVREARTVLDSATNDRVRAHLAPTPSEEHGAIATAMLTEARERVAGWRLPDDFAALAEGAAATYAAARLRMKAARDGADETVHEWRKAVKAHAAHLKLLTPLCPELLRPQAKAARHLGELLGDHHDLAVLAERLREVDGTPPLVRLTVAGRERLLAEALPLGSRLFAEHPDGFADRLARLHKAWRRAPAIAA